MGRGWLTNSQQPAVSSKPANCTDADMINFRRIIYDIVVAALLAAALVASAPAHEKPCRGEADKFYDQRQNGSENYRLNIDGVVIAVAPADSLLAAASEIDFSDLLDLDDLNEIQPKPKPPTDSKPDKPSEEKPVAAATAAGPAAAEEATAPKAAVHGKVQRDHKKKGLKLRLANLLLPLLKKSRHH